MQLLVNLYAYYPFIVATNKKKDDKHVLKLDSAALPNLNKNK